MAKVPKDVRDRILDACGVENLVIALGSALAAGSITFTIVLTVLLKNKEEI